MNNEARNHRELPVWMASIEMVEAIYAMTSRFPREEQFGLAAQMRRAAVSVPSNIAEGAARKDTAELVQFLHISSGSLSEIDTQIEIATRLDYTDEPAACNLRERVDAVQCSCSPSSIH